MTVTVSFEFLIGAAVEIEAVQMACGPVPVVIVPAVFVVVATARVVVATATVVRALVDDTGVVVALGARVVATAGAVFDGLTVFPPQPAKPAANASETAINQRLCANNLAA